MGTGSLAQCIYNLGIRSSLAMGIATQPLYPWDSFQYSLIGDCVDPRVDPDAVEKREGPLDSRLIFQPSADWIYLPKYLGSLPFVAFSNS